MKLLLILLWSMQLALGYHMVFEKAGSLATAVSYTHHRVTINIRELQDVIASTKDIITKLNESAVNELINLRNTDDSWHRNAEPIAIVTQHLTTIELFMTDYNRTIEKFYDVVAMFPQPKKTKENVVPEGDPEMLVKKLIDSRRLERQKRAVQNKRWRKHAYQGKQKRFAFSSIVGTLMGIFTSSQISSLNSRLNGLVEQHQAVATVVRTNDRRITELSKQLNQNQRVDGFLRTYNTVHLLAPAKSLLQVVRENLDKLANGFQLAQQRRLAVDFLSHYQVQEIFAHVQAIAKDSANELLINQPSDLLQIEVSYLYDRTDLALLLHVPMIPERSLLNLYTLHPFPVPLADDYFIVPEARDLLLGATPEHDFHLEVHTAQLQACHTINNIYICPKLNVLSNMWETSCLGSLYSQNMTAAINQCHMKIEQPEERIKQLTNYNYLVFSPEQYKAKLTCQIKKKKEDLLISPGIATIRIPPGCSAKFKHHLIYSTESARTDDDIKYVQSQQNAQNWMPISPSNLKTAVKQILEKGVSATTFTAVLQLHQNLIADQQSEQQIQDIGMQVNDTLRRLSSNQTSTAFTNERYLYSQLEQIRNNQRDIEQNHAHQKTEREQYETQLQGLRTTLDNIQTQVTQANSGFFSHSITKILAITSMSFVAVLVIGALIGLYYFKFEFSGLVYRLVSKFMFRGTNPEAAHAPAAVVHALPMAPPPPTTTIPMTTVPIPTVQMPAATIVTGPYADVAMALHAQPPPRPPAPYGPEG